MTRYVAPSLEGRVLDPARDVGHHLDRTTPRRVRGRSVRSPPAAFFGLATRRPVVVTRRPSIGSLRPADGTAIGAGRLPVPRTWMSALAGRISSWPYGAASFPVISSRVPALDRSPAPPGRWTTRPAVASPIAEQGSAYRAGPSSAIDDAGRSHRAFRPAGARTASSGIVAGDGVGEWASVSAVGVGVGVASGSGSGLGVGVAVGLGLGVAVGVGRLGRCAVADRRRSRVGARRRRGRQLELAGQGRVDAIARRSRPGAVALAQRAADRRDHPRCEGQAARRQPAR